MRAQPCDAGIRRHVRVAVHGEAAQEVVRVVQHPVEAGHLPVDVPLAERCVAGRARRRRDDEAHLPAAHDEQHLPRLVDLDVVAAVAGEQVCAQRRGAPRRRRRRRQSARGPRPSGMRRAPRRRRHRSSRRPGPRSGAPAAAARARARSARARRATGRAARPRRRSRRERHPSRASAANATATCATCARDVSTAGRHDGAGARRVQRRDDAHVPADDRVADRVERRAWV